MLWGAPQGEENDSCWFEEKLPACWPARGRPLAVDRFDSSVVDEVQRLTEKEGRPPGSVTSASAVLKPCSSSVVTLS